MKYKSIDEYMKLPYHLEIIPDVEEGGYVASYPELPGCLTCAETMEQVLRNAEDAKREWLLATMEMGSEIPEPDELKKYSGQFKIRMPKSLHKSLVLNAKKEGISLNQYCLTLLAQNNAKR